MTDTHEKIAQGQRSFAVPWVLGIVLMLILMIQIIRTSLLVSEAIVQGCSIKKVFLKISQNSLENICARVSFFAFFFFIVLWLCPLMGLFSSIYTGWSGWSWNTFSLLLEIICFPHFLWLFFIAKQLFFFKLHQLFCLDSLQDVLVSFFFDCFSVVCTAGHCVKYRNFT